MEQQLDRELGAFGRALASDGAASEVDLEAMYAHLRSRIGREERTPLSLLRQRSTAVRLSVAGLGICALLVAMGAGRPDLHVYPPWRMASILGLSAVGLGLCVHLALRPLHKRLLPSRSVPAALAMTVGVLTVFYLLPAAHTAHPASMPEVLAAGGLAAIASRAGACTMMGLILAVPVYLLLRALDRGGLSRGLLAAVGGALAGNIMLQLNCPVTAPSHLVLGHLGGLAVMVGLNALIELR